MHGDVGEEVIVMAELNNTLNNSREQSIWLNSGVVQVPLSYWRTRNVACRSSRQ